MAHLALGDTQQAFEEVCFILHLAERAQNGTFLISFLIELALLLCAFDVIAEGIQTHGWKAVPHFYGLVNGRTKPKRGASNEAPPFGFETI